MNLTDTTCPECGGDCKLDMDYMRDRHSDPLKAPENERMWKCTRCRCGWTNSTLVALQEEKEKNK
jgi:hypothetical protein